MFSEVKRRNPNHYIKNPTKVHFESVGGKKFVFEQGPKNDAIKTIDNKLQKLKDDYKALLPRAPTMSIGSPGRRNTKFTTLGSIVSGTQTIDAN